MIVVGYQPPTVAIDPQYASDIPKFDPKYPKIDHEPQVRTNPPDEKFSRK